MSAHDSGATAARHGGAASGKKWGKNRERDQASSGNRGRENEEVKGDVCVVSDL